MAKRREGQDLGALKVRLGAKPRVAITVLYLGAERAIVPTGFVRGRRKRRVYQAAAEAMGSGRALGESRNKTSWRVQMPLKRTWPIKQAYDSTGSLLIFSA